MSVQVIERDGKPEWAVLPYDSYLELVEQAEMLQDVRDYDRIKNALTNGEEETVPGEVVFAFLDGENPLKGWREYRHLSQARLAEAAGISVPYLSQIENNKRQASTAVLSALARVLQVTLDDLVPAATRSVR
jgi:DNA-binding XRE family transcriptional regulator